MQTPLRWQRNSRDTKTSLIPPRDALRSVVRKFMDPGSDADKTVNQPAIVAKKVAGSPELGPMTERLNRGIAVSTFNLPFATSEGRGKANRIRLHREDSPWEGDRTRWEFKDWGNKAKDLPA